MPFTYCTQCGYKNVFTIRQANFCAGCGESLLKEATPNQSQNRSQSAQANFQEEVSTEETHGNIPNISKLEYSIDLASKGPTIGDIINTKEKGPKRAATASTKKKGKSKKMTVDEIEAQTMRECASSINRPTD